MSVVARIWSPGQDPMLDEPVVEPVDEPADSDRWAAGYANDLLAAYLDAQHEVRGGTWRLEVLDEDTGRSPANAVRDV